jgi:hypothetical protein
VIKRISIALGMLLCASTLGACSDDFDPPSLVNKLRVLAVQANTPFARPGQEIELEALAYDPEARTISWGWGTCQAAESTQAVDCLRQTSFAQLQVGENLTRHRFTMPETNAGYVGVVVIACPGRIQPGTTASMPVACVDRDGAQLTLAEFELGMKRIYVRDSGDNQNPRIDTVMFDDTAWNADSALVDRCQRTADNACTQFVEHTLRVDAPGASQDTIDGSGLPIREQSVLQFYASGGEFEEAVKLADQGTNKWRARREDAGQRITFWFVVRDDRGGVSWITRTLQVP